jgi:hypothetical protein
MMKILKSQILRWLDLHDEDPEEPNPEVCMMKILKSQILRFA